MKLNRRGGVVACVGVAVLFGCGVVLWGSGDAVAQPGGDSASDGGVQRGNSARSIAVLNVFRPVELIMTPIQKAEIEAYTARQEQLRTQLDTMQEDMLALEAGTPELEAAQANFQTTLENAQREMQGMEQVVQEKLAKETIETYRRVQDAARAVADELGYMYVFNQQALEDDMMESDPGRAAQLLLTRAFVSQPDGCDITDLVVQRLGLEEPEDQDDSFFTEDAVEEDAGMDDE